MASKACRLLCILSLLLLMLPLAGCRVYESSSTAGVSTTTAAAREYILVGRVVPVTGPLASFGIGSPYVEQSAIDYINEHFGGVYIADEGRTIPLKLVYADSDSSPATAYEAAVKLIQEDGIDIMVVSNTADTVRPVSEACETYQIPCISTDAPVDVWLAGGPYKYSFHAFFDTANELSCLIDGWDLAATNRLVGIVAESDFEGEEIAAKLPVIAPARGYTTFDPGRYDSGTTDYSPIINQLKAAGCEIIAGVMKAQDFAAFWQQCQVLGYKPKVCTIAKACLFEEDMTALGPLGDGLISEVWWSVDSPFRSSISGWTAAELAKDYQAGTESVYVPATVGYKHANVEIVYDILKRAQSLDPELLRAAAEQTDLDTVAGHIKFDSNHACIMGSVTGQWQIDADGRFEQVIIANKQIPEIAVSGEIKVF